MSFGKLKRGLKGLINRKDLTDELAGDFINRAVEAIERVARVEAMKVLLSAEFDGTGNTILIPAGYLSLVDIFTDEGVLDRKEKTQFFAVCPTGSPSAFIRAGQTWMIRPTPPAGSKVYVEYFAETSQLNNDGDTNLWTSAAFDAILYNAASLAADYFQLEDPYVQRFQGRADALVQAIVEQNYDDVWSGSQQVSAPEGAGIY